MSILNRFFAKSHLWSSIYRTSQKTVLSVNENRKRQRRRKRRKRRESNQGWFNQLTSTCISRKHTHINTRTLQVLKHEFDNFKFLLSTEQQPSSFTGFGTFEAKFCNLVLNSSSLRLLPAEVYLDLFIAESLPLKYYPGNFDTHKIPRPLNETPSVLSQIYA